MDQLQHEAPPPAAGEKREGRKRHKANAESLSKMLAQAVHTEDRVLMISVLKMSNNKIVNGTVRKLPSNLVVPLLKQVGAVILNNYCCVHCEGSWRFFFVRFFPFAAGELPVYQTGPWVGAERVAEGCFHVPYCLPHHCKFEQPVEAPLTKCSFLFLPRFLLVHSLPFPFSLPPLPYPSLSPHPSLSSLSLPLSPISPLSLPIPPYPSLSSLSLPLFPIPPSPLSLPLPYPPSLLSLPLSPIPPSLPYPSLSPIPPSLPYPSLSPLSLPLFPIPPSLPYPSLSPLSLPLSPIPPSLPYPSLSPLSLPLSPIPPSLPYPSLSPLSLPLSPIPPSLPYPSLSPLSLPLSPIPPSNLFLSLTLPPYRSLR